MGVGVGFPEEDSFEEHTEEETGPERLRLNLTVTWERGSTLDSSCTSWWFGTGWGFRHHPALTCPRPFTG